jgi:hypothetical protein
MADREARQSVTADQIAEKMEITNCTLDKIGAIVCESSNELRRQAATQRDIRDAVESLLQMYRSVHPAEAFALDRLALATRHARDCDCGCRQHGDRPCRPCGGQACESGECRWEPCLPPDREGGGRGDGYSRKSTASVEPVRFEEQHPRWTQIPKVPHEGEILPVVRQGPFVGRIEPARMTPQVRDFRSGPPPGGDGQTPVTFRRFTGSGVGTGYWPPDMSGARGGDVVLMSGNLWLKLSVDGGATFSDIKFEDVFAAEGTYGGWGCDQVVHYVPSIDCFVLYVQAFRAKAGADTDKNIVKIAVAGTADLKKFKGGKPAWRRQWHFTSDTFALGSRWMDFPDLTFGDKYLYVNSNTFAFDGTRTPPGQYFQGKLFYELPLAALAAGQSLSFRYAFIQETGLTFGSCAQNVGAENYWAAHVNNSRLRIYSSKGDDEDYFWRERDISNWPMTTDGDIVSAAPDFADWISVDHRILGATRVNDQVWFAWSAGTGNGGNGGFVFPQPHIQVAKFSLREDYKLVEQTQVWNADTAFAYPSITTNSNNEVGISLAWGGGKDFASHAVGILGDFVMWYGEASKLTALTTLPVLDAGGKPVLNPDGTPQTMTISRWGDYTHVRLAFPDSRFFSAFGYAVLKSPPTADTDVDYLYVEFGREALAPSPLH